MLVLILHLPHAMKLPVRHLVYSVLGVGIVVGISGCGKGASSTPPPAASSHAAAPTAPTAPIPEAPATEPNDPNGLIPVVGNAQFGTQCPYGFITHPNPYPLELWSCPIGLPSVELSEPLEPIFLQVDCDKKTVSARTKAGHLDTFWEIMPDGSFTFTIQPGKARLKTDGSGNDNCTTPLTAEFTGKIDCKSRDQLKIKTEVVWWLGKTSETSTSSPAATASPSPTPSPSATAHTNTPNSTYPGSGETVSHFSTRDSSTPNLSGSCKLPAGCYFYTSAEINQCQ